MRSEQTRKNLIIFGYQESEREGWKDISLLIRDLGQKLQYNGRIDYDNAFRLGPKMRGKSRPILLKLMRTVDKFKILGLTKNLRGTSISIDEDFTPEERKIKVILRKKASELRKSFPDMNTRVVVRRKELWTQFEGSSTTYKVTEDLKIIEKHLIPNQITQRENEMDQDISDHSQQ